MKKQGILNRALLTQIACLGHTDTLVLADCGLPVPRQIPVVDLSVVFGLPRFQPVLQALLSELEIEACCYASEAIGTEVESWFSEIPGSHDTIPHEDLKRRVAQAAFVVRTGEDTPWANVILRCGVPFGK